MHITTNKRFIDYNRKYASFQRTDCDEQDDDRAEAALITRWDLCVQSWPQDFVQLSVYGVYPQHQRRTESKEAIASEVEEWQKFRVSMKGQSTKMKLWRLKVLYAEKCYRTEGRENWARWKCRIDNYIGALVRGGQLEAITFKVLR